MPENLTTSDFDYPLDERLIAQSPLAQRDQSRLMRLRRADRSLSHHHFSDLPLLLGPGDLLVLNDTRVVPARFFCRRPTGGKIEGLFLREVQAGQWEALLKGANRCHPGECLQMMAEPAVVLELAANLGQGQWALRVRGAGAGASALEVLERCGTTPLPPYIHRPLPRSGGPPDPASAGASASPAEPPALEAASAPEAAAPLEAATPPEAPGSPETLDRERYQTVYAERPGAVAAPTAGLHFTPQLLERLAQAGIRTARVTLHVGAGTFQPVKVEDLSLHRMHQEWYELSARTAGELSAARREGRRIVAVGTTSLRVLETAAQADGTFAGPSSGWTSLFLYPPATFRSAGALITNFHLPRSTLLMLVAAFCSPGRTDGRETILQAYAQAQQQRYRFFSYGDAMLIE